MQRIVTLLSKQKEGNVDPVVQFTASIHPLYLTLKCFGLWPQKNPPKWYKMVWYITLLCWVFHLFGPIAGLIRKRNVAEKLVESVGTLSPIISISLKWVIFSSQMNTIGKIIDNMIEDWADLERDTSINHNTPGNKRIMTMCSRIAEVFFSLYMGLTFVGFVMCLRGAIVAINSPANETNYDNYMPMLNSWYPLDYNRSVNVQFLVTTQSITSMMMMFVNAAIDGFFVAMTLHLSGQFRILQRFIEALTYDSSGSEACETKVRRIAMRHQVLLSRGEILQDACHLFILQQAAGVSMTLCFVGYNLITEMEKAEVNRTVLAKTGFLTASGLQLILAYCLVGQVLINESNGVAIAVYNVEWYNFTRTLIRSFSIVMMRSRNPVQITGVKLFPMSLENFTVLIKATMSYLSVLRALGINKKGGED